MFILIKRFCRLERIMYLCALFRGENYSICPYLAEICPLTAFWEILHWKIHYIYCYCKNAFISWYDITLFEIAYPPTK